MKKEKILDVTFIVIVKLDTIERLENVLTVTNFLVQNFETNIIVYECATHNNGLLKNLLNHSILYLFKEDHDPILYRTKYLNQIIHSVETPYISVWDADVIAPVEQILKAVEYLRNSIANFVYPYERQFLDTTSILRNIYIQEKKIEILEQNSKKMKEMYAPNPVGGAFLADLRAYKKSGLENDFFYGWGVEDGERYLRWKHHGYIIKRILGPLFHLSHTRGPNSTFHNTDQQFLKRKELLCVRRNIDSSSQTNGKIII